MIIAVDGMGGDSAPDQIVKGCIEALKSMDDIKIILTGKEQELKKSLSEYNYTGDKIDILNAEELKILYKQSFIFIYDVFFICFSPTEYYVMY